MNYERKMNLLTKIVFMMAVAMLAVFFVAIFGS